MPLPVIPRRRSSTQSSIPGELFPTPKPLAKLVRLIRRASSSHKLRIRRRSSVSPPPPLQPRLSTGTSLTSSSSSMSEPHTPDLSNDAGSSVFDESSTSQVYVEPEVPDPFLIDDDASDDDAGVTPTVAESRHSLAATQEVELAPLEASLSPNPLSPSILQSPNRDKDVPPPPSDSDTDEEEEPELYLPALVVPTMFLPLPNTDPLTTLLTKYIHPPENRPSRDLAGEWQHTDFHTLVMSNSWRALARMARDRIVTSDPEDLALVLGLWYLRLSSLARLRLFNQTTAECNNLFNLLNSIEPLATRQWLFDRVLPFELEVMNARLKYWAGDHMGYLDALHALLRKCKSRSRRARDDASVVAMWKERGARVCLIIASQLVEMKDYTAATTLLTPLCTQPAEVEDSESSEDSGSSPSLINSPALHSAIARIYLQCGNLAMAMHHFGAVAAADSGATEGMREMNAALMAGAEGDWVQVTEILQGKVFDAEGPERLVAVNNLCVALLNQGKLKEGIAAMERVLKESPESVVVAEPYLFNLSTLYELRSATAIENKRKLLVDVARWSGDGLKTTCLKMPT